jgi:hypothetical protein
VATNKQATNDLDLDLVINVTNKSGVGMRGKTKATDLIPFLGGRDAAVSVLNTARKALSGTSLKIGEWYSWDGVFGAAVRAGKQQGSRTTFPTFTILGKVQDEVTDDYGVTQLKTFIEVRAVNYSTTVPMNIVKDEVQRFTPEVLMGNALSIEPFKAQLIQVHGIQVVSSLNSCIGGIDEVLSEDNL